MRWSHCALLFFLLLPRPAEAAEKVRVAVAQVRARRSARPDKLETGIRSGLASAGVQPIASNALGKAARDVGVRADSAEGARAAGADYLVKVKMSARKRRFTAAADLIRASDGEVVESIERGYNGGKGALTAGKAIGKLLGRKASDLGRAEAEPPPVAETPVRPIEPPEPPPPTRTVVPKEDDDDHVAVKAEVEGPTKPRAHGEFGIVRAGVAGGFQAASAYTVALEGQPTGLAYSLTPLALVDATVSVRIPQVGLFFGARADFSPVKYAIDVMPPVDPAEPKGRFLSAGGTIGYEVVDHRFSEAVHLRFSPVIGINWSSMSVQSQGDNTVVVSWSAIDANGGVEASLILLQSLAIELHGRGGYVFSYSESPKTTGEGGAGFDLNAGLALRYWILDLFGVYLDTTYEYMKVGMSGMGSRVGFVDDPPIVDATIYSADLKLGAGLMIGI